MMRAATHSDTTTTTTTRGFAIELPSDDDEEELIENPFHSPECPYRSAAGGAGGGGADNTSAAAAGFDDEETLTFGAVGGRDVEVPSDFVSAAASWERSEGVMPTGLKKATSGHDFDVFVATRTKGIFLPVVVIIVSIIIIAVALYFASDTASTAVKAANMLPVVATVAAVGFLALVKTPRFDIEPHASASRSAGAQQHQRSVEVSRQSFLLPCWKSRAGRTTTGVLHDALKIEVLPEDVDEHKARRRVVATITTAPERKSGGGRGERTAEAVTMFAVFFVGSHRDCKEELRRWREYLLLSS